LAYSSLGQSSSSAPRNTRSAPDARAAREGGQDDGTCETPTPGGLEREDVLDLGDVADAIQVARGDHLAVGAGAEEPGTDPAGELTLELGERSGVRHIVDVRRLEVRGEGEGGGGLDVELLGSLVGPPIGRA
jgi:hypothetical protein